MSITKSKNGFAEYPGIPRTGSVRIPSLVVTLSKPQHQNDFDKIFATAGTELRLFISGTYYKGRNRLIAGSTSQKLAVTTLGGSNKLNRMTA